MTTARFLLTIPNLSHEAANERASRLDEDFRFDPMAVTINETDEARGLWEISLYFATRDEAFNAARMVDDPAALIAPVPDRDWVRQSLEGLAPVAAGRFFLHGAHDRARRRSGGVALEIDAGMAFGTGHHGTTEGCLMALDEILKRRSLRKILDVGCGTGVLAIAAVKATHRLAIASDIDPEAVRVTKANAALNGAGPLLRSLRATGLQHPAIVSSLPYDLIFANILARPLVALALGLSRALAPGGDIVVSGLTLDQMRWIEATYIGRGLVLRRRIARGNWATLVFTKLQKEKAPKREDTRAP